MDTWMVARQGDQSIFIWPCLGGKCGGGGSADECAWMMSFPFTLQPWIHTYLWVPRYACGYVGKGRGKALPVLLDSGEVERDRGGWRCIYQVLASAFDGDERVHL